MYDITEIKFYNEVQQLRLIDDIFMNECFNREVKAVEFVLRIILNRDDINITRTESQAFIRGWGRSLELDILAEEGSKAAYNIEVQRKISGASIKRARFHVAMLDYLSLNPREKFNSIRDNYVIFITEYDVMKKGLPIEIFDRLSSSTGESINDGSHIIYVNGECRNDNTPLGRLMHDFFEPDPDKMYYDILAERVRLIKSDNLEVKKLSGIMEKMRAEERAENKKNFVSNMLKETQLAFELIAKCAEVSIKFVQNMAKSLGIEPR